MKGVVFLDSNIPMYLLGAQHPLKERARIVLEEIIRSRTRIVTSAEVLQECCHRYKAISRLDLLQPVIDTILGITDQVYPVTQEDVLQCKIYLLGYQQLSARDALHFATMTNLGIKYIFTFDSDFDNLAGIERIH